MTVDAALSLIADRAAADLRQTRFETRDGTFFAAGAHQFASFWTRDFCLAVPGLLRLGETEVVATQLRYLLALPRRDGLIARGFDTVDPKRRVLRHTLFRAFPGRGPGHQGPLHAEHLGEHGTPAADSNALVIGAMADLAETDPAAAAGAGWSAELGKLLDAYLPWLRNGLIHQPPFSDWQDSARREGPGLFLHLCVLRAARTLVAAGFAVPAAFEPHAFARRVLEAFADPESGLLRQHTDRGPVPLESQLMILNRPGLLLDDGEATAYFEKLRHHPIWMNHGVPVHPAYPVKDIAWTVRCVGLRSYHDGLSWSWLLADQFRCARNRGDDVSARKILTAQARAAEKHGRIHEVYRRRGDELIPFAGPLYRSEGPFTWGAARWIAALQ